MSVSVCVCVCVCAFSINVLPVQRCIFVQVLCSEDKEPCWESARLKETHTHTYIQTEREKEKGRERHTYTQTHKHMCTQTHSLVDSLSLTHSQTQTDTDTDRQTDRQIDRQTDRQRQIDRHTHTHTHTHRVYLSLPLLSHSLSLSNRPSAENRTACAVRSRRVIKTRANVRRCSPMSISSHGSDQSTL